MKKLFFVASFFMAQYSALAQPICDVMFESVRTPGGIVISSRVLGDNFQVPDVPLFTMISPQGTQIWREESDIAGYIRVLDIDIQHFDENHLYAHVIVKNTMSTIFASSQIWKVSLSDGQVVWKSEMTPFDMDVQAGVLDYDGTDLLYYYGIDDYNGGTIAGYRFFLMDKSDAGTSLVHEFTGALRDFEPLLDYNKNLIIGTRNSASESIPVIRKYNGLNLSNVMWQKSYIGSPSTPTLPKIDFMTIDPYNQLYAVGDGDIFKINIDNGSVAWQLLNVMPNFDVSHSKFKGDFLYLSGIPFTVGSEPTWFHVVKINTITGIVSWNSIGQSMTPVGIPTGFTGDNEAALAFDIDCNDDIYATGYSGSANWHPGAWGIMKISGESGLKMGDITVSNNLQYVDTESVGLSAYVYNNEPVFLGNLEFSSQSSARAFVKPNPALSGMQIINSPCPNITLGINEHRSDLDVYPNPTKDLLNIKVDGLIQEVAIFNIAGLKVLSCQSHCEIIDMGALSEGVYLLKITMTGTTIVEKIIKH